MTRINVIPVQELTRPHLIAEYRELPRIFGLAHKAYQRQDGWNKKQPSSYKLGEHHCIFFYDKLLYLAKRHKQLVDEMLNRGYAPQHTECLEQQWREHIPSGYWKDYVPTQEAIHINVVRINERLGAMK